MSRVRVAAVQFEVGRETAANLAACLRLIDQAAAEGAELIVLPEFCNHLSWYDDGKTARRAACRPGDGFLNAIAARAVRHQAYIKIHVTLARQGGRTTATNLLYAPDGTLAGQADKLVLMGAEGDHLDPGTAAGPVVPSPCGRLGLYSCMEGVISEVCRDLAVRGAQVLLNSLNSFATDEASLHVPVRAAENRVWVVAANKVGPLLPAELVPAIGERLGVPPEWLHGAGESQIVAPDGTVLAKGPRAGEAVVVADIDPAAADDKVRPDGTDIFTARRPRLYGPIVAPPRSRTARKGAEKLAVAVVRATGADRVAGLTRTAASRGAELIVLPELAFDEGGHDGRRVEQIVAELAEAVRGTRAYAVTSVRDGSSHVGLLVNTEGEAGRQPQLHTVARHAAWATEPGEEVAVFDLPWGRLAIVVGDDSIHPETFRLAAIADADVVAVPFRPLEPWETGLGLLERSAENRLNVVAAGPGEGLILALPADFTLWTPWEGPFTGRISHPIVTRADGPVTLATIYPAQAVNRDVSKNTDLVGGRPWKAVAALHQEPEPPASPAAEMRMESR